MAVKWRKDSVKELQKRKTLEEIQKENELLSIQLTDTQLALCDVYEQLIALASMDGGETVG